MSEIKETNPSKKSGTELGYFLFFLVLTLLFSLFCLYKQAGSKNYSIFSRTWGFDHLLYYGTKTRLMFYLLVFVCIFPFTNKFIVKTLSILTDHFSKIRSFKFLLFVLLSFLAVLFFYFFRVKYYFLGDFNLRYEQIIKHEFLNTEYMTMRLLGWFADLGEGLGYGGEFMFKLYSCVCGAIFVFFTCLIADLLGKTGLMKLFYFLMQIASAMLLVFCGYIEVYATPIVCLTIYIYSGLRYLEYNKGFYVVIVCLILAIAAHLLCLAALPSILLLWYFKNKKKVTFVSAMQNKKIALIVSLLILAAIVVVFKMKSSFVLPLSAPASSPKHLTFFSMAHFWELINGQLLCGGLALIFLVLLCRRSIKEKIQLDPSIYFLLGLTGCLLLIILLADLQRGSGDWDIMAFSAVAMNLLLVSLLSRIFKKNDTLTNYLLVALIGIHAIQAFLWINIHHTDRSIQKIENMLISDPGTYYSSRISGILQLTFLYKINHLEKETQRVGLKACYNGNEADKNACLLYAESLRREKKLLEVSQFYEDLLVKNPIVPEAYLYLFEYFNKTKEDQKYLYYVNRLFDEFRKQPNLFLANKNFKTEYYLMFFEYLYNMELPQKNSQRLDSIYSTIQNLKQMLGKKN